MKIKHRNTRLFLMSFGIILLSTQAAHYGYSQAVGFNNPAPDASSIIDAVATDRGVLIPRMSTGQRNAIGSPAKGLLVYDTTLDLFYFNSGTSGTPKWVPVNTGFHASKTRIKILPSDFMPGVETGGKGAGKPTGFSYRNDEDVPVGDGYGVVSDADDAGLVAFVVIPTGYEATHARIYGNDTGVNFEVYESDITTGSFTLRGSASVGSEADITDVDSTDTNFLVVVVAFDDKEDDIAYGGYVTIAPM